jgi:hypothetical protein
MTRRVHLFVPCLVEGFCPEVGLATADCLAAAGCDVVFERRQTCCGQAFLNAGLPREATRLARRFVRLFRDADVVVGPSGSCAGMIRDRYGDLLDGPELTAWEALRLRVFELSDFLVRVRGLGAFDGRLAGRAALHWSCHLPPGGRAGLAALLGSVVELAPEPVRECCGFGGTFWTLWRDVSAAIGRRRVGILASDRPDWLAFAEPGCLLQARCAAEAEGLPVRVHHVAELLSAALRGGEPGRPSRGCPASPTRPPREGTMAARASSAAADGSLGAAVLRATDLARKGRAAALAGLPAEVREAAIAARRRAVEDGPALLEALVARLQSRGVHVHRAATATEARGQIARIAEGRRLAVKGKTLVGEEIGLASCLEGIGCRVVETDLGEFIVQLRGERPSHLTSPALHVSRDEVGRLFADRLGIPYTDDPTRLAAACRAYLRQEFLAADLGIVGVNFAIAGTGDLVTVTNEGNGRLCKTLPRTLIAVTGIDRTIATTADCAALLRVLSRNATGPAATTYVNLLRGPASDKEPYGPTDVHLVLVDNGRSGSSSSLQTPAIRVESGYEASALRDGPRVPRDIRVRRLVVARRTAGHPVDAASRGRDHRGDCRDPGFGRLSGIDRTARHVHGLGPPGHRGPLRCRRGRVPDRRLPRTPLRRPVRLRRLGRVRQPRCQGKGLRSRGPGLRRPRPDRPGRRRVRRMPGFVPARLRRH